MNPSLKSVRRKENIATAVVTTCLIISLCIPLLLGWDSDWKPISYVIGFVGVFIAWTVRRANHHNAVSAANGMAATERKIASDVLRARLKKQKKGLVALSLPVVVILPLATVLGGNREFFENPIFIVGFLILLFASMAYGGFQLFLNASCPACAARVPFWSTSSNAKCPRCGLSSDPQA